MNKCLSDFKLLKESFLEDLIIVTGAPASGKSMLAPIVGSLDRAEHFKMSILLEHLGTLNALGKLDDDVLIFLLRYTVDFMLYNNLIGREMNFRLMDETSVFNTHNPEKYFERLVSERGEFILDEMKKNKPLLVLALSDAFAHAPKWFEAFSFLKFIHIERHPVDIVHSWYNHRYGENVKRIQPDKSVQPTFGSETYASRIGQVILAEVNGEVFPYYALSQYKNYSAMSEMERVIYMIKAIHDKTKEAFNILSKELQNNILFLTFDETVEKTDQVVDRICAFMETKTTPYTSLVLEREGCPRALNLDDRVKKMKLIQDGVSTEALAVLETMVKEFDNNNLSKEH